MWGRVACLCASLVVDAYAIAPAESPNSQNQSTDAIAAAFLASREIGVVRLSPDRRWIAAEIYRARSAGDPSLGELAGEGRSDLWVFDLEGDVGRAIASGGRGAGGAWAPVWSPHGDRVAFVTNRGTPGIARLAVWDLGSQTVIHETARGISLDANFGSAGPYAPDGRIPMGWVDNDHILAVLTPEDHIEPLLSPADPKSLFGPAWDRAASGAVSATTWDAGELKVCGSANELVSIDLKRGNSRHLVAGSIRAVAVAQDGSAAVVVRATAPVRRDANGKMRPITDWNAYTLDPNVRSEAVFVSLGSGVTSSPGIDGPFIPSSSIRMFPRWSEFSKDAFVLVLDEYAHASLLRVSPSGRRQRVWSGSSAQRMAAVAKLASLQKGRRPIPHLRLPPSWDNADHAKESQTIDLTGARFAILELGEIAIIDSRGIVADRKIVGDVEEVARPFRSGNQDHLIVRRRDHTFSHITLSDRGIEETHLLVPDEVRGIYGVSIDGSYVVRFQREQSSGIGLLRNGRPIQPLVTINEQLSASTLAPPQLVNLSSDPDQPRYAQVFYPPGYHGRHRLPTIVKGYPGEVFSMASTQLPEPIGFASLEAYYLAASGYLVVRPSLPVAKVQGLDVIATIADDVDRSVDALIRLGISDPQRIGYFGHSYGGYAGLSVAIHSRKFGAIVVSAAFADLFYYATYVPAYYRREECAPSRTRVRTYELETNPSVLAMHSATFLDLPRYLHNSAVYRAKEIATPLLLIHGEFDMAPIESVEQLFLSLEARGVPTRLIRYWGEGHNLENPANIRNSLEQMTQWFDKHLRQERPLGLRLPPM
jgi:dipeptidyl aminopeptidase/acylaminoacyl peptidase